LGLGGGPLVVPKPLLLAARPTDASLGLDRGRFGGRDDASGMSEGNEDLHEKKRRRKKKKLIDGYWIIKNKPKKKKKIKNKK
jgi:hypothetical protein